MTKMNELQKNLKPALADESLQAHAGIFGRYELS